MHLETEFENFQSLVENVKMLTDLNVYCFKVLPLMMAYEALHGCFGPSFPLALRLSPPVLLLTCRVGAGREAAGGGQRAAILASLLLPAHSRPASALVSDLTVP